MNLSTMFCNEALRLYEAGDIKTAMISLGNALCCRDNTLERRAVISMLIIKLARARGDLIG